MIDIKKFDKNESKLAMKLQDQEQFTCTINEISHQI